MRAWLKLVSVLILLGCFWLYWLRASIFLDSDFGWHLRMGQIILAHGIPATDVFSYTMSHFPMVDHEWLTNVFIASVFPYVGFWGLGFVFAGVAVCSLILPIVKKSNPSVKLKKDGKYQIEKGRNYLHARSLLLLVGLSVYSFIEVRPQIISWFFFAIFSIVLVQQQWKRLFYFLPLLMVIWVNLHGGFAVGIFLFLVVFLVESISRQIFEVKRFFVFVTCVLMTFINPYGYRIWGEIWMQLSDSNLRSAIVEWGPATKFSNLAFWTYVFISLFLFFRYRRRQRVLVQVCYLLFFLMAMFSMRHIPLWLIISLPVTLENLSLAVKDVDFKIFGRVAIPSWYGYLLILFLLVPQLVAMYITWSSYSQSRIYPVGAVEYLRQNSNVKRVFALYDWNSYILWQLPNTKIFIDGMMPSWRWNYSSTHESSYAFEEYRELLLGELSLKSEVGKYRVDTVVLPVDSKLWDDSVRHYSISGLVKQIQEMRWKKVYQDKMAVVYRSG